MLDVARAYPARTLITLVALIVAGIVQGLSLSALLPMLQIALDPEAAAAQLAEFGVVQMLIAIGLTPELGILLILFVVGMVSMSLLVLFANRHVGYTVAQIATDLRLNLLRALLEAPQGFALVMIGADSTAALVTVVFLLLALATSPAALAHRKRYEIRLSLPRPIGTRDSQLCHRPHCSAKMP